MAFKIIISPRAQMRMDNIVEYILYQLKNPTAATAVVEDIEETYRRLQESALSFGLSQDDYLAAKGYHKIALRRHEYVVLYTVCDNEVHIAGIFHMRENYRDKL